MARSKKRSLKTEQVRLYVEGVAKNLVDKLYGPEGPPWGTTLTDIEDLLLEVREVLTEQMLDLALARQAQVLPQQAPVSQRRRKPLGDFRDRPARQELGDKITVAADEAHGLLHLGRDGVGRADEVDSAASCIGGHLPECLLARAARQIFRQ